MAIGLEGTIGKIISSLNMSAAVALRELLFSNSSAPMECLFLVMEQPATFEPIVFQQSRSSQSPSVRQDFLFGLSCETTVNQTRAEGKRGSYQELGALFLIFELVL